MSRAREELRKRLEFKFASGDALGVWEIMQRKEVYSRVKDGTLDGYFAMAGMISADERLHGEYVSVFERSEPDAPQDEGMVKRLMGEMETGRVWREVGKRQGEAALGGLEDAYNGGREGQDVNPWNVVDDMAPVVGKWLSSEHRRRGRVLRALLENHEVRRGIVEGRYNKELLRMMSKDKELEHVLYDHVLRRPGLQGDLAGKNGVLAREMVANGIEQGQWLYSGVIVSEEAVGRLFSEGDGAFEKVRRRYRLKGDLSLDKLRELVRRGKLDRLVESAVERLVRYGEIYYLKMLIGTEEGKRVFEGLMSRKELDTALGEGIKRLVRDGEMEGLQWVIGAEGGRRVFEGLMSRKELDPALGEGMKRLVRSGKMEDLRQAIEINGVRRVFAGLFSRGELDLALRGGIECLVEHGWIDCRLKMMIETLEGRFDELVRMGELDTVLKKWIGKLIAYRWIGELKELIGVLKGRFDELVRIGGLDTALEEGMKRLVRYGEVDELQELTGIEIVKGKFDELVEGEKLDAVLKEGTKSLIECERIDKLEMLMGVFKGRFDELLSVGELDAALAEGAGSLVMDEMVDELRGLMGIEAVGVRLEGLVRSGKLDAALEKVIEGRPIRYEKMDKLRRLMGVGVLGARFDELVRSGELDVALTELVEHLIECEFVSHLRKLMGIETVKRRVFGGLLNREELISLRALLEKMRVSVDH